MTTSDYTSDSNEIYAIIKQYPNYRVSNYGRVQSRWSGKWKDLSSQPDAKGYLCLSLCDGIHKPKSHRVHRLVAIAFLEKSSNAQCVRHLDGNPANNSVNNLAWGTYRENENDKHKHGTWDSRNGGAKLTPNDVTIIRELALSEHKHSEIALQFGVSRPTITRVINRVIWKTI